MNQNDLITKFQELKQKQSELMTEKLKCEAKRDQLAAEIKSIQDKYPQYDLSSVESVNAIIANLSQQIDLELIHINEQYEKIKAI